MSWFFPDESLNTDPKKLAERALALGENAGALDVVGTGLSGLSKSAAYLYQSKVASNNAKIMKANANAALSSGQYAESVKRIETGEKVGAQRAAFAANNVDVGQGSAARVQEATANIGEADALAIRYNAAREAYAMRSEASQAQSESTLAKFGTLSSLAGTAGSTYSSWLSASQSLLNKKLQLKQYGAISDAST